MSPLALGIDGGGTRTRAAIVDETGTLLGYGVGGPTNYDDIGIDATRVNLAQAIHAARQSGGLDQQVFDSCFLGLAGIVSENDHRIVRQIATDLQLAPVSYIGVDHDCRIALAGGLSGRAGIVLIAGTGSACYGRSADGNHWLAGGWGELLADEGSGSWLGLQALRAAVRGFDGRGQPTRLTADIMQLLDLQHMNDIMYRVYHQGLSRKERATLAPLVLEAARAGDDVALSLLREGIEELVLCVQTVAHRLNLTDSLELVTIGGLQQAEDVFAQPLRDAISAQIPGCHIQLPELSPVIGACVLALEQLGVDPGTISDQLRAASQKSIQEERAHD